MLIFDISEYIFSWQCLFCFVALAVLFNLRKNESFAGLAFLLTGGLLSVATVFLARDDQILYSFGLGYDFVTFVKLVLVLLMSVLWISAAAKFYNNQSSNLAAIGFYFTFGLIVCVYYSFFNKEQEGANTIVSIITNSGLLLLSCGVFLRFAKNKNSGNFLLFIVILLLITQSLLTNLLFKNFAQTANFLNWLWLYIFPFASMLIKQNSQSTELKKNHKVIDTLNLQINNMIDSSPFPIVLAKITGDKLLLINTPAASLLGISKKEVSFHKLKDFFVDEANRQKFFNLLEKQHEVQDFDIMVCDLINATPFWLSVSAKTIEYNNEIALYMAFQDVTMRKQREDGLQAQADKDPLTMAWNRRYFEKLVPENIKECIRKSQNFSLLLLDADKFKNINDTYGHKLGDKVLIELADICRTSLRTDDIVARFGGEEFVVFLNNTDTDSALKVAERLRQNIENTSVDDDNGNAVRFTVSIGVVSSEKTSSLDILLRQVDDAMYLAKKRGRNQVALYDEEDAKVFLNKKTKHREANVHPIFQNEENEEISLLDNYDSKIL
ncbi:MAG: sensor domain-containing diguanylate cyclase [Alphaproteobacteria bacterium]|nr:sensor domain-containing diguanylate cyclase [Alphaproteobacteria bacterium]